MLEDFLIDIYNNALALELLKESSYYSSIRQSYKSIEIWNEAIKHLTGLIDDIGKVDKKCSSDIADSSSKVKENFTDLSAFASIIDNDIVPKVSEYLKHAAKIDVDDGSWTLLSSQTGFLTLKDRNGMFLHSYYDPMWENFLYALSIYDPYVTRYNILGGGLGYLAYQLWWLSEGEADVYVYEVNDSIAQYSYHYGVMSMIDEDHIHLICDDDKDLVVEKYFEEIPGIKIIRNIYYWNNDDYSGPYSEEIRSSMITDNTRRVFDKRWKRNYSVNNLLPHFSISEFDKNKLKDEWVVVAAGPSLNDNTDFIIDSVGKRTICTINTTLKWFSAHNILPDLCLACDPNKSLIPYIEGYQEFSRSIPIIADYITNCQYLKLYQGPRFLIHSDTSSTIADDDYDPEDVWNYGGTVTSMAIEAAFRMGARKIYLVGADLAYPGRVKYADGVGAKNGEWDSEGVIVASVDDKRVHTSLLFNEYIRDIEEQVSEHPDCEVINRSLHGAYLKGTYCGKWWENIYDDGLSYIEFFEKLQNDTPIIGWREKYYLFWQAINSIQSKNLILDDREKSAADSAYNGIFDVFKSELDMFMPPDMKEDKGLTYIFTNEFWDKNDQQTIKVLKAAKTETQNRKKVLIINTSEKLGGIKVSVHKAVAAEYNHDLEKNDNVIFENHSFPYFQFPEGMPNIDYYRVFLGTVLRRKPEKLFIESQYSLLADYCASELNVEVVHH